MGTYKSVPWCDGMVRYTMHVCRRFIRELEEMLVKDIRNACARNTNPRAKPKASDTKSDLIYKRVFGDFL